MAVYRSAEALGQAQRNRAKKVRRSLEVATKAIAEEMRQEAIRLTSGTVSTAQLRRMGHPYARRRTGTRRRGAQRGNLPRLPIHRQSGKLQKSLRVIPQTTRNGISWRLQFTSPHAVVLTPGGTSKMVARGFWAAMRKHYYGKARRRLIQAWRLANK